jgi:hypothetical protein
MPLTGEEKKAYQREYMRGYMRLKRLENGGLNNEVLTKNELSRLDSACPPSRSSRVRAPSPAF